MSRNEVGWAAGHMMSDAESATGLKMHYWNFSHPAISHSVQKTLDNWRVVL